MLSSLKKITIHTDKFFHLKYVHSSGIFYHEKQKNLQDRQKEIMQKGLPKVKPIDNVKKIIIVASGKGGVGKSTTAVNLATALKISTPEKNIGLLDTDIFGPSLPLMMNLHDTPLVDNNKRIIPLNNYGVKCMSMGFLIEEGSPVIWRGLMVMQALEKLIRGVNWGETDYLIIDTPPGTGDTHLSLIQNIPIDGVILVSTPQNASLQVTKRGAVMFQKLKVPIIGLVENMSSVECPKCSNSVRIFGSNKETYELAENIDVQVLQQIPMEGEITIGSDNGVPVVIQNPNSKVSQVYKELAQQVIQFLAEKR